MKISTTTMQVYSIDRPRSPVAEQEAKPTRMNKFSDARFAELLSAEEKQFISKNFKTESANKSEDSQLGRHLDVVA